MSRKLGLSLIRPLAFIDLETTGTDRISDRIVEIGILKCCPDGREDLLCKRVNPGIPIQPDAIEVHGITDADVASEPPFEEIAPKILEFLAGCDIGGFNVDSFDLPLLQAEFQRAGFRFSREGRSVVDAMRIFHAKVPQTGGPRNLEAAVLRYCGREFPDAHCSEGDVRAVADVLEAQLSHYPDLPRDVRALHDFRNPLSAAWIDPEGKFAWDGETPVITFGKYKWRSLKDMAACEAHYLEWMLSAEFSPEVKEIVAGALRGQFPVAP